jgi:hypothetical protein
MFRSGTDLAARVHRFNRHPAAYAHPSRFEDLMSRQLFGALRSHRRAEGHLSNLLLERHGLENDCWYDFASRRWRFALLSPESLLKLVNCCGLVFQHRRIAATVERSARGRLVAQILVRRVADKPPGSDGWPLFNRILRHELNPKWQTLFS